MRILVTSPDRLGDFLLRQPMLLALMEEGHQLLLVASQSVGPLVSIITREVEVALFDGDPYSFSAHPEPSQFEHLISQIRAFRPERIVVAPHQWTVLDECIVEQFAEIPTIGFTGNLYRGNNSQGFEAGSRIRFSRTVAVSEDDRELRKNELLCAAVLGRSVRLSQPSLEPDEEVLRPARARLVELGLKPGRYWISSVGHSGWTAVRNWGAAEWAETLRYLVERSGLNVLLVGTPNENEVTNEVRSRMGSASEKAVNLCCSSEGLDLLVGLTAESSGYVGRDTGPMHIAAALAKTVVAVFGGGTWPRFIPAAQHGAAVTTRVPCSGCQWICHLPEAHCVKAVPVRVVIEELERVLSGMEGFRVRELPAGPQLSQRMAREAAESIWELKSSIQAAREERKVAVQETRRLTMQLDEVRSKFGQLQDEHFRDSATLGAIRKSVFTRLLMALRIWRPF